MKHLQFMEVTPDAIGSFFDYVPKQVSKGQRDGHQRIVTKYILSELWEGAWECYYPMLMGEEYLLTTVHMHYLETREKCMQHGDPTDLKAFKQECHRIMSVYRIKASQLRKYLNLTMESICGARIKMDKFAEN